MQRLFAALVPSLILCAVSIGGVLAADDGAGGTLDDMPGMVYVDTAFVRPTSDEPASAELMVTGSLPSPCHEPVWEVEHGSDAVRVWLWSWSGEDTVCAAVLEPFELTIPLDAIEAGTPVLLDGEPVEWSEGAPGGEEIGLTGAGWSFGMCLGYCAADLELNADAARLTGHDRESTEPVFANEGKLTAEGRARIEAAVAAIDDATLESVYGCPDCADGGAAYLELKRTSGESRHEMEFGAPPEPLADLYGLATDLSDALESCISSELVTVADTCVAYVPPAT